MKYLILLAALIIMFSCSSDDPALMMGSDETKDSPGVKYLTITNGDNQAHLYMAGMIGLAPSEISKSIEIRTDTFTLLHQWSNKDYTKTVWDTIHISFIGIPENQIKNVILRNEHSSN